MEFLVNEKGKYLLSSIIAKSLTEIQRLDELLSLYMTNMKTSLGELEDKRNKFNAIKEKAVRDCDEVKRRLDKQYNSLLEEVQFEVDLKLNEVFGQIYQMIDSMSININNYTEAIPKFMESQMTSFVNSTLYPQVKNTLEDIKNQLNITLYNVKNELHKFKNETLEEVKVTTITTPINNIPAYTIFESESQAYLPVNSIPARDIASTIAYAGGAIGAGMLIAAMITRPIGLILGALAGGALFKTLDNNKMQRDKNFVFSRLNEIKEITISRTKARINQVIKQEYNKLEQEIYSEIDDSLSSYDELFNDLINEKRDKAKELNEKSEKTKIILFKTNEIEEKLNSIMKYMGENY